MTSTGIHTRLKNFVAGTAVFRPIRAGYQFIFDRETIKTRTELRDFYRQFISPGEIVFDVGANVGEYTDAFASDGAALVVAAEPNPACAESLDRLIRLGNVRVEHCAVGDKVGEAELRLCDNTGFGTLNRDWPTTTRDFPSYQGVHWGNTVVVPVVTLDVLAERYGIPSFIKIDVEGFEDKVLSGMSFRPGALSFEFNARAKHVAFKCLANPIFESYEFNAIEGREFRLCHSRWLSRTEVVQWLTSYKVDEDDQGEYGDIFARVIRPGV